MRIALTVLALLLSQHVFAQDDLDSAFASDVLIVHASENACYRLDIYIAQSSAQKSRGLMFVRDLPELTGMLFIYEADAMLSMWMKNTFIPLDILFIRTDGTVSSIAYDTEPQSLKSISALEPVRYVLELNAGAAEKLSIDKYSRIEWDGLFTGE